MGIDILVAMGPSSMHTYSITVFVLQIIAKFDGDTSISITKLMPTFETGAWLMARHFRNKGEILGGVSPRKQEERYQNN